LDFGGKRAADGLGFAAFGRVVKGMDVVRQINQIRHTKDTQDAYLKGQMLTQPVVIESIRRL
jgi:peptidyl-prolyl cis-trans isomerase A (cyclophilin A)